jgi:hypothetical protein
VLCVLATIARVCGDDCITAKLHITIDFAVEAGLCHAPLARALWSGEYSGFQRAILAREPFGLVAGSAAAQVTDVYVPDGNSARGQLWYRGLAGGLRAVRCESVSQRRVWAFSSAEEAAKDKVGCTGVLFIDSETGHAYSEQSMEEESAVPIRLDWSWAACVSFLPFPEIGSTMAFPTTASSLEASCWLAFYLGPHATAPVNLTIVIGQNVTMRTDLIVRSGSFVQIISADNDTINVRVGPHQIVVEKEAHLHLHGLYISDSDESSALLVYGTATVLQTIFTRCNSTTNYVTGFQIANSIFNGGSEVEPVDSEDSQSFSLLAVGGGIHIAPGGFVDVSESSLLDCAAVGIGLSLGLGGAVFANANSRARFKNSQLLRNTVKGTPIAGGGGIYQHPGSEVDFLDSLIAWNSARGSQALGGGAFIMLGANMAASGAVFSSNVASGGASGAFGGAVLVFMAGRLSLSESVLQHNSVSGNGPFLSVSPFSGGAICVWSRAHLLVSSTLFRDNAADGEFALYTSGGAVAVLRASEAIFTQVVFIGNSVFGARVSNWGGALRFDPLSSVQLQDSELSRNYATGPESAGGAIHTDADTLNIANVTFCFNRASASLRTANGGALCVQSGQAKLEGCRLHHNVAETIRGGFSAFGGAVQATGDVLIRTSRLWNNNVGGYDISDAQSLLAGPGSHVHSEGGSLTIDSSEMADEGEGGDFSALNHSSPYWLFVRVSLLLRNSSFIGQPRQPGQPGGQRLLQVTFLLRQHVALRCNNWGCAASGDQPSRANTDSQLHRC